MLRRTLFFYAFGAIILISSGSFALPSIRYGFEVGANYSNIVRKVNYTYPWVTYSNWDWSLWRPQVSAGFFMELPVSRYLAMKPALRFVRYGTRIEGLETSEYFYENGQLQSRTNSTGNFILFLDYLSLPVHLKIQPPSVSGIYMIAGLDLGYLLSAHQIISAVTTSEWNPPPGVIEFASYQTVNVDGVDLEITNQLDRFNLSAGAGLGYQVPLGKHSAQIELRYTQGLTKINNKNNAYMDPDNPQQYWKTRGLELAVDLLW